MRATDIVGYTYKADLYCPVCIVGMLPTGPGEEFDGWALAEGVRMSTEENLTEIAAAFGIDRMDEETFDSDDFPKVVFASQALDGDHCGRCHTDLV